MPLPKVLHALPYMDYAYVMPHLYQAVSGELQDG